MAHSKYALTDRLRWNECSLSFELITRARWKKNKDAKPFVLDVIKRRVSEKRPRVRNMYKPILGGWLLIDPSERFWWRENGIKDYGIDNWNWSVNCNISACKTRQSIKQLDALIMKYEPQFIYTFRAFVKNYTNKDYFLYNLFLIYKVWKQYKECEYIVKLGFIKLAQQKSVYKLSKNKKREIMKYISQHVIGNWNGITEIQECMLGIEYPYLYRKCGKSKKLYDLIMKQDVEDKLYALAKYRDYKDMCIELHKNLKDPYWLYPKNIKQAHDKVMAELNTHREMLEKQKDKDIDDKLALIPKCESIIKGFTLYLANDLQDIREQAKTLFQCLISCKYYEKVANKESLLIFIKKGDTRVGTCEISYNKNKEIKQFYLDEHDRNDKDKLIPNKKLKDIMNEYISKLKINNRKQITLS